MNNVLSWFRRQGAPVTVLIIASMIVASVILWTTSLKGIERLALGATWQQQPWTLLTYPWAYSPFFNGLALVCFVFLCMWIFMTGGQIERDLGPIKYSVLWLVMILLPALFIVTLGPFTPGAYGAMGMWLPEAAIAVIWCIRNPSQTIMLYGVIPLQAKWLAWVTAGITVAFAGAGNPLFGFVAGLHLIVAWAFATNLLPFWRYSYGASSFGRKVRVNPENLKKSERMDKGYYEDVKKREKEREERERLRKLFESSIDDGDSKKG